MTKTSMQSVKTINSTGSSPHIALIGCGAIAESYYLPALARFPAILENLILVDRDIDRARKLSTDFNVKEYLADYREALSKVDGAIIALPIHLHHLVSMKFLLRGIPVLCEKPLAETASKAAEMINESRNTGATLATNYSQRLWPQFAKVKDLITSGSLGEPVSIKYFVGEVFKWPTISGFYFNSSTSSRGILRDRGAHVLDHICWWLGGKPEVRRSLNDSFGGSDAVAYVEFEYKKCIGEVKLSWLGSFPCKFYVEFEHGFIEGDVSYPQSVIVKEGGGPQKQVNLKSEGYAALGQRMVTNFIDVVAGNARPLVPGSDVIDSIRFTEECYAEAAQFDMPWYKIPEVQR